MPSPCSAAIPVNTPFPLPALTCARCPQRNPPSSVDEHQRDIGRVLTCATDMAIGRHDHRIFSIVSPDKPVDFTPRGLSCGFVKVTKPLKPGQIVRLKDKRRTIKVEIVDDIRPDRTARKPLAKFIGK